MNQLKDDLHKVSGPYFRFSHNNRYLAYLHGGFNIKIALWDLETDEKIELVDVTKEIAENATIGAIAFSPDDEKIFYDFTWHSEDGTMHTNIASVNITTGIIEQLNVADFQAAFYNMEISPDGKWIVTGMITMDDQVCFLVNLEERQTKCVTVEKGWYSSPKFTLDSSQVVYSHHKKITSPSNLMLSNIDNSENKVLVSGLVNPGWIPIITDDEIVFIGRSFDNLRCANVYIINIDGSDLRKLSYLGEQCRNED